MITNSQIGRRGRLGNQLFQYAFLYAQARRLGTTAFINDRGGGFLLRRYRLDDSGTVRLVDRRQFRELFNQHIVATVDEFAFHYTPELAAAPDRCDYHGFFQTERYFDAFADDVRAMFQLMAHDNAEPWRRWIAASPLEVVSVHVRRGDYTKNPAVFANLDQTDYYRRADEAMLQLLGRPYQALVFSDDIAWCRANPLFPPERQVAYVTDNDQFTDLYVQTLCRHHIIANSSFSWWGAWLAAHAEQQVIAPATWFGPKGPAPYDTIYCPGWHVLSAQ